jgi:hypothetical protein
VLCAFRVSNERLRSAVIYSNPLLYGVTYLTIQSRYSKILKAGTYRIYHSRRLAAAQGWLQILSGGLQRAGTTFRTPVDRESGRLNVPRDWLATRYGVLRSVVFLPSSSSMGMKAISSCFDIRLSPAMRRACGVRIRLLSTRLR